MRRLLRYISRESQTWSLRKIRESKDFFRDGLRLRKNDFRSTTICANNCIYTVLYRHGWACANGHEAKQAEVIVRQFYTMQEWLACWSEPKAAEGAEGTWQVLASGGNS